MKFTSLSFLFVFIIYSNTVVAQINQELIETKEEKYKATSADSLITRYNKIKLKKLTEGDTLNAIKATVNLSNIYSSTGNYSQSYDGYWEALIYANTISDTVQMVRIYRKIGMLYSIFRRGEKAEEYFDLALRITKISQTPTNKKLLALKDTYYIMASHNREHGNYGLAEKYLDSCRILNKKLSSKSDGQFLDAKQGYIYYHQAKYNKALNTLLPLENYFIENSPTYLVIFYSFLGDIYFKKQNYTKGENYYLKALEFSKKHQSHSNFIPDIYQKLGNLYFKTNKKDLAYINLQLSKDLAEEFFGVRSRTNSDILEIKDAFRIENEKQNKILETEKLNKLEQQQKTLFFRNVALTVSILSLVLISGFIMWHLHRRRKFEKQDFLIRQKLSREKNAEILALKNRELTTSSLQMIQKDALILEIKEALKNLNNQNEPEIKQILAKIKINKSLDWKVFNARFTSVNKVFYKTLSEKFPELTRRDHRLCALIKLNFSSKEISSLLGISSESVNTSRYRLRKKMGLKKEDALSETIAKL